jgi:hypothetical protein
MASPKFEAFQELWQRVNAVRLARLRREGECEFRPLCFDAMSSAIPNSDSSPRCPSGRAGYIDVNRLSTFRQSDVYSSADCDRINAEEQLAFAIFKRYA